MLDKRKRGGAGVRYLKALLFPSKRVSLSCVVYSPNVYTLDTLFASRW